MMKAKKGQCGYIRGRKRTYLYWAAAEFAVVAILIAVGYLKTGTKLNLMTAAAVLVCLPAAKMLVEFIVMVPYPSIAAQKQEEIQTKGALLTNAYDLILTSPDGIMAVDAIVILDRTVCGFTSNEKTDEMQTAAHIRKFLRQHQLDKITVKIFHDYTAFLARVEGMNNIASVDSPETKKKEQEIRSIILSISM